MRRELVLHIGDNGFLTVFQAQSPIRRDLSIYKTTDEIKDILVKSGIRYTLGVYEVHSTEKNIDTYHVMNIGGNFVNERNIYLINESENASRIVFSDRCVDSDAGGMTIHMKENKMSLDNLRVFSGSKSFKRYTLTSRKFSNKDIFEYTLCY